MNLKKPSDDQCKKYCSQINQYANISLPIEIKPEIVLSEVGIECCGQPEISCQPADQVSDCQVVIKQTICLRIPIRYGFTSDPEDVVIDCDKYYGSCKS